MQYLSAIKTFPMKTILTYRYITTVFYGIVFYYVFIHLSPLGWVPTQRLMVVDKYIIRPYIGLELHCVITVTLSLIIINKSCVTLT